MKVVRSIFNRTLLVNNVKRSASLYVLPSASFSDVFHDRERAAESSYFNKQDVEALRKLMKKLKAQSDHNDSKETNDQLAKEVAQLKKIPNLKLTDDQVSALIKWKHDE